jgi:hypothetical protein
MRREFRLWQGSYGGWAEEETRSSPTGFSGARSPAVSLPPFADLPWSQMVSASAAQPSVGECYARRLT